MAEAVLGSVALVLSFRGAVDSFLLLDSITEADNGSPYLAVRYNVAKQKFNIWADHFKLLSPEESPLRLLNSQTRRLIAAVLVEIQAVNNAAKKYLKRYELLNPMEPKALDSFSQGNSPIDATLLKAMKDDRESHGPVNRFLWATKDKAKFTEIVEKLHDLVADLNELAREGETSHMNTALPIYVVPNTTDLKSLEILQQPETSAGSLLSLSALLKQIQIGNFGTSGINAFKEIPPEALGIDIRKGIQQNTKQLYTLSEEGKLDQQVWIEWKKIKASTSSSDRHGLELRIKDLIRLLSVPKPLEYRTLTCLGLTTTEISNKNYTNLLDPISTAHLTYFGFIYEYPSTECDQFKSPFTLLELLKPANRILTPNPPVLNERFKLASALASSMALMHASRWLHKGFRSSKILFFQPKRGNLTITSPYVTGFELSRPEDAEASIERVITGDNAVDLYQHPESAQGFNRLRDYYSLGVVLFEIALWRAFEMKIPKDKGRNLNEITLREIHHILMESLPLLGSVMGTTYRDVVELCLTSAFDLTDDEDGATVSRVFFQRVVRELEKCNV